MSVSFPAFIAIVFGRLMSPETLCWNRFRQIMAEATRNSLRVGWLTAIANEEGKIL